MRSSRPANFLLLAALTSSPQAKALAFSEDFSSATRFASGSLVWNSSQSRVHVPLQVYNYQDLAVASRSFSVGVGSDGAFVPSRYAQYSQGGDLSGQIIRLDTDANPVLEVSEFVLAAGWTLAPVGSQPLVIRSQGDVIIQGIIDCSGQAGEAFNGNPNMATQGGSGRCGGGNGGAGGAIAIAAQAGSAGGPTVGPGPSAGGGATLGRAGGGGGGSYGVSQGAGFDAEAGAGAGGGSAGIFGSDLAFTVFGGGFGGGGGGVNSVGGAEISAGGGGGGGGGHVFITSAGAISITGSVLASGGVGGGAQNGDQAGGGGGGAGGSIAMFAGDDVYLFLGARVEALGGAGGSGGGGVGQNGGRGSDGRTWLVGRSGFSVLVPPNLVTENPVSFLVDVGAVRSQTGSFTVTSGAIDLGNSRPTLNSVNIGGAAAAGATVVVEFSSGEDPQFVPTTWLASTSVPQSLSRYMRFRIRMDNTLVTSDPEVTSLTANLSGFSQGEFEFKGACGAMRPISPAHPTTNALFALLGALLPLLMWFTARRDSPRKSHP